MGLDIVVHGFLYTYGDPNVAVYTAAYTGYGDIELLTEWDGTNFWFEPFYK